MGPPRRRRRRRRRLLASSPLSCFGSRLTALGLILDMLYLSKILFAIAIHPSTLPPRSATPLLRLCYARLFFCISVQPATPVISFFCLFAAPLPAPDCRLLLLLHVHRTSPVLNPV